MVINAKAVPGQSPATALNHWIAGTYCGREFVCA
jgi:hypothetical protein